jgi:hypothetical protein
LLRLLLRLLLLLLASWRVICWHWSFIALQQQQQQ